MFSRDVTYKDLLGRQRTRRLTFNLTIPEATRLEFRFDEGFRDYLAKLIEDNNRRQLFATFELLITVSYGVLTPDGTELVKDPEELKKLLSSTYYEELFIWLWSDEANAAAFFNNIVPKNVEERLTALKGEVAAKEQKAVSQFTQEELEEQLARLKANGLPK